MVCNPELTTTSRGPAILPDGVPPLTTFYLYLTSGCNLCCRHCWITPSFVGGQPSTAEYLDVELLRRAIAEAKPLGLASVKLTGGEPLLHPHFRQVVDLLTAEGLSITLETNGTLLDKPLTRHLKEHTGTWFVAVSLDGPSPAVHDPFRGVTGSFAAAVAGIKHLVAAGYRPQIIMSLHRGNIQYVEETIRLAVELGAGSVKFNPVMSSGRGIGMHERGEALTAVEVLALAHQVRGSLQQRTPIRLILSTPPALYTVEELLQSGLDGECSIRHVLGILGSGEMALCGIGRTVPELCFGNLGEVSVREAWTENLLLRQLRQELDGAYPGLCGDCIHTAGCLTYCAAQNYQDNGRLISPTWLCAQAYAEGLFPVSRLRNRPATGTSERVTGVEAL